MSDDSPQLRRSKRNKFYLDVAHLDDSIDSDGGFKRMSTSPSRNDSESPSKRPRRDSKPKDYAFMDEDTSELNISGLHGHLRCTKCPARFDTRPGLSNHTKMHGLVSDQAKLKCEKCDFACISAKAMRNHKICHEHFKHHRSASPAHSDTHSSGQSSAADMNQTPPRLIAMAAGRNTAGGQNTTSPGSPPRLEKAPPAPGGSFIKNGVTMHQCAECPFATRNRSRLEAHTVGHTKNSGFRCHHCSFTSHSPGFLQRHITMIHGETSFPWPPRVFVDGVEKKPEQAISRKRIPKWQKIPKERGFARRAMVFPSLAVKVGDLLKCPLCTFLCHTKEQIASHKHREHTFKSLLSCRCSTCGLRLPTQGALRLHKIKKHEQKRKIHPKVKKILIRESVGRHFLAPIQAILNSSDPSPVESPLPTEELATAVVPSVMEVDKDLMLMGTLLPENLRSIVEEAVTFAEIEKSLHQPFKCADCPYTTNAKNKLERHSMKHQVNGDDLMNCPICSFSCRGEDIIRAHVRVHYVHAEMQNKEAERKVSNQMPNLVISMVPSTSSASSSPTPSSSVTSSTASMSASKPKSKRFIKKTDETIYTKIKMPDGTVGRQCLECPYVTKHSCDLSSHYQMHLSGLQRFQCSQCTYSTKRAVVLRTHYIQHKEQNTKQSTGRELKLKANGMDIGMRSGKGKYRIYSCGNCPFVARTLVKLWIHARNHIFRTGSVVRCAICPYYGISIDEVEDHLLLHNEEKDTDQRVFAVTPRQRIDMTKPNPYLICIKCSVGFTTEQAMYAHQFTKEHRDQMASSTAEDKDDHEFDVKHPKVEEDIKPPVLCREDLGPIQDATVSSAPPTLTAMPNSDHPNIPANPHKRASKVTKSAYHLLRKAGLDPTQSHSRPMTPCLTGVVDHPTPPNSAPALMPNSALSLTSSASCSSMDMTYSGPLKLDLMEPVVPEATFLHAREQYAIDNKRCPDCPFADPDPHLMMMHREMHGGEGRPLKCDMCNFSCSAPQSLHQHLALHLPLLSPNSAAAERRQAGTRRRQAMDIPTSVKAFSCTKCSFRCILMDEFTKHMQMHAMDVQRRLVTMIKRQNEESKKKMPKPMLDGKVRDNKNYYTCKTCGFRSQSFNTFMKHVEFHEVQGMFKCRICNYSSNTHSITMYHELNHHEDHTLYNLKKSAILAPDMVQMKIEATDEDWKKVAGRYITCERCPEFKCLELCDLYKHFKENHNTSDEDKERTMMLSMDIVPASSIISSVS